MKFSIPLIILAFIGLSSSFVADYATHAVTSVMTYDVHIEHCKQQPKSWDSRKATIAQIINSKSPEILGIQAATLGQTNWLANNLPSYSFYAPNSEHLEMGKDMCPILYSTEHYSVLDQGTFLIGEAISKTDEIDSQKNAKFLNWIKISHKRFDKKLFVLNTKIDHQSAENAPAIAERIKEIVEDLVGDETFIFVGGLNCQPNSKAIGNICTWAKDSQKSTLVSISEKNATHFGWTPKSQGERLDYIFLSKDIPANSYEVIDTSVHDTYPSDHLPVYCRLRLE